MAAARLLSRRRIASAVVAVALLAAACGTSEDASLAVDNGPASTEEQPSSTESTSNETTEVEREPDPVEPGPEAEPTQPEPSVVTTEPQAQDPLFFGEFATLDGATVDLADFAGQDVVLWFWAPW